MTTPVPNPTSAADTTTTTDPATHAAIGAANDRPDVKLASWRMVTQSVDGDPPTSDVTLRVLVDDLVVLGTGDGTTPAHAYVAAEAAVLDTVASTGVDTAHVRTRLHSALAVDHACVSARAVHVDGLMGRIAALVTPFPVTNFTYHRSTDGSHAHAKVCLEGTDWQVERVAHKIRRAIGVLEVRTDTLDHH